MYHGLGSGKTATSIAIAEGMKDSKRVIIMTPASLRANYVEELKKQVIYFIKEINFGNGYRPMQIQKQLNPCLPY